MIKNIAIWSVENRVTINLIMIFVIVAGLNTVMKMQREMFPQFALDMINITAIYPGATPGEVEEAVCIKLEEKIKGVEGINRIISRAHEGSGSVTAEIEQGISMDKVMEDIRSEVDSIDTFPDDVEDPVITEIENRNPAITIAVYGNVGESELRAIAEGIKDDLVDSGPVSMATLIGTREFEIFVEISEKNLKQYGLTFDAIVSAVKQSSVDLPGGVLKTDHGEIVVRTKGQMYSGAEFAAIPIITKDDGTILRLGDIARVTDGFEDVDKLARFNGKPAALVQVNRTSREDVIKVSKYVRDYVKAKKNTFPAVGLATWYDLSDLVQGRIDLLLKNGLQGIVLVFLVLALFLNLRLAFWVAAGIPISFMGAFLVLNLSGASINMISLFGFIMTLGILVDDAIIVGENVFRHYSMGKLPKQAVIEGVCEVGGPVVIAVATTIAAFTPLMNIDGIMGKFIAIMPMAVITILAVSLLEALILLPAHLEQALERSRSGRPGILMATHERVRGSIESFLTMVIDDYYTPAVRYVVRNRYFTLAIGFGILIVSMGIVAGGYVPFVFLPKGDSNWIIAEVGYPPGTPFTTTEKTIELLEKKAFELEDEYKNFDIEDGRLIENVFSLVGVVPRRDWKPGQTGGHCGEVWIEIASAEKRPKLSIHKILARWRVLVGEVPGVETLTFTTMEAGPGGNPIEIELAGDDFAILKSAAVELKGEIKKFPGTFDITDDFKPGKLEKQIRIKPGAKPLGISMVNIARQVRQAFYGDEILNIQRGRDDVKVRVRYSGDDRTRVASIEDMYIRTDDGRQIPIGAVADVVNTRSYSSIKRVDRKRVITVISDVDESMANSSRIISDLKKNVLPGFLKKYPGVSYKLEGQAKRSKESIDSLKRGFLFAAMIIYLLLATVFKSYNQPFIIMMAIPFGLIGAVAGHMIMGFQITMLSLFGIVALSGIVVNDSLILIEFINKERERGCKTGAALVEAGRNRFRAVFLTSVTTIAGLSPLLFERSFQAQFLIPMAVSISFGLIAATLLTLLYVPALYGIIIDIEHLFSNGKDVV